MTTKVIFLDRDGTINELIKRKTEAEPTPPWNVSECNISQSNLEALREFCKMGFGLIVVTNQPDAAKGKVDIAELKKVEKYYIETLKKNDVQLLNYFVCYHHPEGTHDQLSKPCDCRKPGIGMFKQAAAKLKFDKNLSWMIGDSLSDIIAGKNFGLNTIGLPSVVKKKCVSLGHPSFLAKDLRSCVKILDSQRLSKG